MTVAVELQITDVAFGGKGVALYKRQGGVRALRHRWRERFREYYTRTLEIFLGRAGVDPYRFALLVEAALSGLGRWRAKVLRLPINPGRTSAGAKMAAGEGRSPAYRRIKRTADAAIYSVADRI